MTAKEDIKCLLMTWLKRGGDKMIIWKPTHQTRTPSGIDVMCWHYEMKNPIPQWVFKNFHNLGDGKLTHRSGVKVELHQWIVRSEDTHMAVFTDEEFEYTFRPLPNA